MALARYAVIGALATSMHYIVLMVLVELMRVLPGIAASCGAMVGAAIAYAGNRAFTFASDTEHRQALPRFLVVVAIAALLNGVLVWLSSALLGLHYLVSQLTATAFIFFASYRVNRIWTFT